MSAADRHRLAGQLGETIAALYQLPPPVIRDWRPADWPAFGAGQRARCVSGQRALSAPALWADQIPWFLDGAELPSRPPVPLHTEVMRLHLLTAEGPKGAWRLSGPTGFEPTIRGEREYEFICRRGVRRRRR